MKKLIILILSLVCIIFVTACGKNDEYEISFTAPAGLTEKGVFQPEIVYSDQEISPVGNKIIVYSSRELGDSEVVLIPIEAPEEEDLRSYITPGYPAEIEVEKGAWYKVGVAMQNSTDEDITVTITIENIEVRIE